MESFIAKPATKEITHHLASQNLRVTTRSIPNSDPSQVLLDVSRYISEKTTRAFVWHAILRDIEFEFHLGTERDFLNRMAGAEKVIVGEVHPLARNYNKIYLVFDKKNNKYSYAISQLSGYDRAEHFVQSLKLISFGGAKLQKLTRVNVFDDAGKSTLIRQYEKLDDLYRRLPVADLAIVGQKGAIESTFEGMAMLQELLAQKDKISEVVKLSTEVEKNGILSAVVKNNSNIKKLYKSVFSKGTNSSYAQFESEQFSHSFKDVEVLTNKGKTLRIRLISNVWGDEVVPIARALKNSPPQSVYYIGTAGAFAESDLKVGDVVIPEKTYTQSGELLEIKKTAVDHISFKKGVTLGQVRTPFAENTKWYESWKSKVQAVELEVGYLRKTLGESFNFYPYLLISDIVGSESETLAHAAQDSSKRKNGQLRLIESILKHHGVDSVFAVQKVPDGEFHKVLSKVRKLKPSRDLVEQVSLTQKAMEQGLQSEGEIARLIDENPSFHRKELWSKIESIDSMMTYLHSVFSKVDIHLMGPDELFNNSINPKKITKLQVAFGKLDQETAQKIYQKAINKLSEKIPHLEVEVVNYEPKMKKITYNSGFDQKLLMRHTYSLYKKLGLALEFTDAGDIRLKSSTDINRGLRCEKIF